MRKRRKSEVSLCRKVVQKRVTNVKTFLGKTFAWQKLCVIFVKSKKITAEVMFALHMNKPCKVERCYPIQKCSDRFRDG